MYDRAINDDHPAREMPGSLRANQEAELEGDTRVFRPSRESLSPKSPAACRVTRVVARPFRVCVVGGRVRAWCSFKSWHLPPPSGFCLVAQVIMAFLERGVACILKSVYLKMG